MRQALAPARIVASYVADRPVAQRAAASAVDGELALHGGLFARRRVVVAGATTAAGLSSVNGSAHAAELRDALLALTAARYDGAEKLDSGALDSAVASALRSADKVASRHTVVAEALAAIQRVVPGRRRQAWAR